MTGAEMCQKEWKVLPVGDVESRSLTQEGRFRRGGYQKDFRGICAISGRAPTLRKAAGRNVAAPSPLKL